MPILLSIAAWVIGMAVLYLVIRAAIDDSDTAHEIKEIRRLLQGQLGKHEDEEIENFEILDTPVDTCPACGARISPTDKNCPDCDLSLEKET